MRRRRRRSLFIINQFKMAPPPGPMRSTRLGVGQDPNLIILAHDRRGLLPRIEWVELRCKINFINCEGGPLGAAAISMCPLLILQ